MSIFQIGVKWVITLVFLGFAVMAPAVAIRDEITSHNLHAHGSKASATVAEVSTTSHETSYLLGFEGPRGPNLEWTSQVEGHPTIGDAVPVSFDPADPSKVVDVRTSVYHPEADALAGVFWLFCLALGAMFLHMTPEDVIAFGKARFGR